VRYNTNLEREKQMEKFNYVLGRTAAFSSAKLGIDIPSLWTATVISGLPNGATMNSGSAATAKEAVYMLTSKMKKAGYSGTLLLVDDVTKRQVTDKLNLLGTPVATWSYDDVITVASKSKHVAMALKVAKPKTEKVTAKKPANGSEAVTFDVWLNTSLETVKAYKIDTGDRYGYVGKSISSFSPKGKPKKTGNGVIQYGALTVPAWLYKKLG
jgi:hypothetical protein